MTATNASPTRAIVPPAVSAASTPRSSSPFIARPWRRIQNSIQVRTATAINPATPSSVSWTMSGSRPIVDTMTMPATIDSPSAAPTPAQTFGSSSFRPIFTR